VAFEPPLACRPDVDGTRLAVGGSHQLRRSIAIAEDLARRELYARAKRSLSVLYWAIIGPLAGQDMLNVGDSKQSAEVYADKALRIAETLAAGDSSNDQARADLVFAYAGMGEALQSTQPAKAGLWYLKSIALAGRMADRDAAIPPDQGVRMRDSVVATATPMPRHSGP